MKCTIINSSLLCDTFVHAPVEFYKSLTTSRDGFAGRLENVKDFEKSYNVFIVPTDTTRSAALLSSSTVPSGEYILSPLDAPSLTQLTLRAETKEGYQLIDENAEELVERGFLQQVRLVSATSLLPLWIEGRKIWLKVDKMIPDIKLGLVGMNVELEIIPPIVQCPKSHELRARRSSSRTTLISLKDVMMCIDNVESPSLESSNFLVVAVQLRTGKTFPAVITDEDLNGWIHIEGQLMKSLDLIQHELLKIDNIRMLKERQAIELSLLHPSWPFMDSFESLLQSLLSTEPVRGIFLQGESMVGKSHFCRHIHKVGSGKAIDIPINSDVVPSTYIDLGMVKGDVSFRGKRSKIDALFRQIYRITPAVVFLDHASEILGRPDEGISEEEQFLHEQLLFYTLNKIETLIKSGSPVVLVCESRSSLHGSIIRSSLFIDSITLERPDHELRQIVSDILCLLTRLDTGKSRLNTPSGHQACSRAD